MKNPDMIRLEAFVEAIPQKYKGPGGAVAVVKDGQVLIRHAWGFANLATRTALTAETRMPICSVSKQFTCATLLETVGEPEQLDGDVAAFFDKFAGQHPSMRAMCNNQSGLRDYWALTVLCGADPEGVFLDRDADHLMKLMRSGHFAPGAQYSYCNCNFRLLAELIEKHSGRSLIELVREKVFTPAGMKTAELIPDTAAFDECTGYEGDIAHGFRPATNRIHWIGDAGICASLDDMIAWEQFIDATRDDENGIYRRLSRPTQFSDGSVAPYGLGLKFKQSGDVRLTGHGGALRGWRCQRWHCASERISVVVLFNFEGDAHDAASRLMNVALDIAEVDVETIPADPSWLGSWLEQNSGLVLTLENAGLGKLKARFGTGPEMMDVLSEREARSSMTSIEKDGDVIHLHRFEENLRLVMQRLVGEARTDVIGRFHNAELDADLMLTSAGGALYAAFEGFLGKSDMYPLYPAGPDVWILPVQRAMDAPSPGEWKLLFERDATGQVTGVKIGCWLARSLIYDKVLA